MTACYTSRKDRRSRKYGATHALLRAGLNAPSKRAAPELKFHFDALTFLRVVLPRDAVCWHTPNGGETDAQRMKQSAMGELPGFPDLAVLWNGRLLGFELKSRKGRASKVQNDCHDRLRNAGAHVFVCRSLSEIEVALRASRVPLRGAISA